VNLTNETDEEVQRNEQEMEDKKTEEEEFNEEETSRSALDLRDHHMGHSSNKTSPWMTFDFTDFSGYQSDRRRLGVASWADLH
jgi:hypothetical protein